MQTACATGLLDAAVAGMGVGREGERTWMILGTQTPSVAGGCHPPSHNTKAGFINNGKDSSPPASVPT